MKAIILARVSTKEQEEEGSSIPAQTRRLTDYAQRNQFKIVKTLELTESSTKENRKKFEALLEELKSFPETVAVIADTVDRVQRSFKESVELEEMRKQGKIEIHFLRENLVIRQNSNSADILRWDMAVMFAKSYVLQLSDNVKRSYEQKLRNGEWCGKAPVGYLNETLPNGRKNVILDPDRSPLVIKAFEWYGSGNYAAEEIAKKLKKEGLTSATRLRKPLNFSQVHEMLQNPFYYGEMRVKEKLYVHHYEPLISRWLFEKCQEVRERRHKNPVKYASRPFVFRGLLRCATCGCTITSDRKKGKYTYCYCTKYRGNCDGKIVKEEVLVGQIEQVLASLKIPEDALEQITNDLRTNHRHEKEFYEQNIQRIQNELKKVRQRMQTMYDDRLDGRITADEYDKKLQTEKHKERDLILQLEEHSKGDEEFAITSLYVLELAERAVELFRSSKVEQKRKLLNFVLSNLQLKSENLIYELKKPFDVLVEMGKTQNWLPRLDSNQ